MDGVYYGLAVLGDNGLFLAILLSFAVQGDEDECDDQTDWEKNDNPVLAC